MALVQLDRQRIIPDTFVARLAQDALVLLIRSKIFDHPGVVARQVHQFFVAVQAPLSEVSNLFARSWVPSSKEVHGAFLFLKRGHLLTPLTWVLGVFRVFGVFRLFRIVKG